MKFLNPCGAEMIEQQKGFKGTEQGALHELPGG